MISATPVHFEEIVALNDTVVDLTSPMDLERLKRYHEVCVYHKVAVNGDGKVIAFIICFDASVNYKDSGNHTYFCDRYDDLIYVDRVAIAEGAR